MVLWAVSHSHTSLSGQEWTVQVKPLEGIFFFRNHVAMSVGLSQEKATITLKKRVYSFNYCGYSAPSLLEAETACRRCSAPPALPSARTCPEPCGWCRTDTQKETFRVGRNALAPWDVDQEQGWPWRRRGASSEGQRGESEGPQGGHGPGRGEPRPHSLLHETGQGPGGPGCPGDGRSGEQRADYPEN